jgi:hypothetical protein
MLIRSVSCDDLPQAYSYKVDSEKIFGEAKSIVKVPVPK